ncbi:TWiK family of potassium channels protein 7-like [Asterias rubens]|uniref:TWiK family of potassium channels protein 7-like n=1 Tax=Asterias rubens TaxID=7604 RepID=UPI0014550E3C|nr:TWiK family of potassium channels protein 7-like [Asterias rubens]
MNDRERRSNDAESPGRSDGEDDDQGEVVMEEYYDEGPDYCKLVQHYSLTYTALFISLIVYACIGAAVFKALEYPTEFELYRQERAEYISRGNTLISALWNVTSSYGDEEEGWRYKAKLAIHRHDLETGSFVPPAHKRTVKWSFAGALFFSCTVISTIGYGNIAPVTNGGRIFCIIYAVFGIAMLLLVLASIGSLFARGATLTYRLLHLNIQMAKGLAPPPKKEKKLRPVRVPAPGEQGEGGAECQGMPLHEEDKRPDMDDVIRDIWSNEPEIPPGDIPPMRIVTLKEPAGDQEEGGERPAKKKHQTEEEEDGGDEQEQVDIPLSIVLVFALMYVCLLAGLLSVWEQQWNYFEAFYFSFITLTTIGFGDLTPVHQKNLLGCTFFILLGMAIMSMCIALAQEIIMKKVAWISERVGVALIKAKPAS